MSLSVKMRLNDHQVAVVEVPLSVEAEGGDAIDQYVAGQVDGGKVAVKDEPLPPPEPKE